MQDSSSLHITILILLIFTAVNLLILDIKVFAPSPSQIVRLSDISISVTPSSQLTTNNTSTSLSVNPQLTTNTCPSSCISLINQSIQTSVGSPVQPTTYLPAGKAGNPQLTTSLIREYFIPLGSGTTSKSDWEDLLGTDTLINPDNYGTIKEVQLSVAIKNPTKNGVVEVRLYNVTDKYVVYGSSVSSSEKDITLTSSTFAFPTGTKLYRLQAKSGLSYTASIDNAKLKILTL